MSNKTKGVIVKKLLLIGTILVVAGCAPRRDEVCCMSNVLSMCEPAIYFDYDSYKVDTENKTNRINLNWIAEKLNRYPDRTVILTGQNCYFDRTHRFKGYRKL